jgi:hypothetical protein
VENYLSCTQFTWNLWVLCTWEVSDVSSILVHSATADGTTHFHPKSTRPCSPFSGYARCSRNFGSTKLSKSFSRSTNWHASSHFLKNYLNFIWFLFLLKEITFCNSFLKIHNLMVFNISRLWNHHQSNLDIFISSEYWGLNSGLSPWATPPTLFYDRFFRDRVSWTFC